MRAVCPSIFCRSTLAPCRNNASTTSLCPRTDAAIRAVVPSYAHRNKNLINRTREYEGETNLNAFQRVPSYEGERNIHTFQRVSITCPLRPCVHATDAASGSSSHPTNTETFINWMRETGRYYSMGVVRLKFNTSMRQPRASFFSSLAVSTVHQFAHAPRERFKRA